jgi:hypothetical protein
MTQPAISVAVGTSVLEADEHMVRHDIHQRPSWRKVTTLLGLSRANTGAGILPAA